MRLLETASLAAFYGDFQALFGIQFHIERGETVAVIGANGAGKSTFLRTLVGIIGAPAASVAFRGRPIGGWPAHRVLALGIALVPEGRKLFPSLSVEENLLIGAYAGRAGPWSLARVYDLFPALAERRAQASNSLSGGEQQMAAIGRALMSNPELLLCDEISLGLAPIVVKRIYATLADVIAEGTSVVVVEQDIVQALSIANRVYCFQEGRVSLEGTTASLTREAIRAAYFGL